MFVLYVCRLQTLFRGKHLKVVVSTATLALGINMPARRYALCFMHVPLFACTLTIKATRKCGSGNCKA